MPGYNALTDGTMDHYALYADSDNVLIKEHSRGTTAISYLSLGTITHSLGYIPFYLVYSEVSSGRYRISNAFDPVGSGWRAYSSTASLIMNNRYGTAGTICRYYIFYDNIS